MSVSLPKVLEGQTHAMCARLPVLVSTVSRGSSTFIGGSLNPNLTVFSISIYFPMLMLVSMLEPELLKYGHVPSRPLHMGTLKTRHKAFTYNSNIPFTQYGISVPTRLVVWLHPRHLQQGGSGGPK